MNHERIVGAQHKSCCKFDFQPDSYIPPLPDPGGALLLFFVEVDDKNAAGRMYAGAGGVIPRGSSCE